MRPEKASIIEDLQAQLGRSPFLLVVDYQGMNVLQFAELRNRLFQTGAECHVVKNTFLRRALKEAGLPDCNGQLSGQTAIVTGEKDIAAAAKAIKSFIAEFQKPTLKLGVLDRAVLSAEQVKAIADLPTRDILLAQFLGVLQAPASKLVRLLNEPASMLARVLKTQSEKSEAPSE